MAYMQKTALYLFSDLEKDLESVYMTNSETETLMTIMRKRFYI